MILCLGENPPHQASRRVYDQRYGKRIHSDRRHGRGQLTQILHIVNTLMIYTYYDKSVQ